MQAIDEFAQHEILHTIHLNQETLARQLLERDDLPESVRELVQNAFECLSEAYQDMGNIISEQLDPTQLEDALDAIELGTAEYSQTQDADLLFRAGLDLLSIMRPDQ